MSVVINFYNDVDNVDMAPFALAKQNYQNYEVILVDDGSTDGTLDGILAKYKNLLPISKIIKNDFPVGLKKARNQGVKSAEGDIIVTLDLHTTFDEDFLKRIVSVFNANSDVAAVGALILPYGKKWFHDGFGTFSRVLFSLRKLFKNYDYVFGTAAAYKSKILEKIGYLSEGKVVEDTDASWRIRKEGFKIFTLEDNVVYHKGPQSAKNFFKTFIRDGLRAGVLLTKYKTKVLYPQFLGRILFLPLTILLFLLIPYPSFLFACGVTVFLFLLGAFATKRLTNAFNFLVITLAYVVASTTSIYLGFFHNLSKSDQL